MSSNECVFTAHFPSYTFPTLCLLRRRARLSRELVDDVMRARGRIRHTPEIPHEESWFDNIRHGRSRGLYFNGIVWWDYTYVCNQRHGLSRGWHMNGARQWEISYVAGKKHGPAQEWNENGSEWWAGKFIDGTLVEYSKM